MKKLIALISTKNKTPGQVSKEMMNAFHNFNKVKARVEETMRKEGVMPHEEASKSV